MPKLLRTIKKSLPTQILIGLVLGIVAGLFFGEMAAWLQPIGDIFLRLFQMPVIPYIVVSLIGSLGGLDYQQAKSIFLKGGAVLLLFWAIILVVIVLFPLGFPAWQSASFFSSTQLEEVEPINLIELFIPVNPFEALSQTIVPAIVLFSIALGFALIGMDKKQGLLDVLSSLSDALMRITGWVSRLTPIGVFAIVGSAVGSLPLDDFSRLGVYVALQALLCLVLSLCILPVLVSVLTPLSFREIVFAYRTPLITAFATANLLIVLPLIIERSKELLQRLDPALDADSPEITAPLNVLIPLSFVFPSMGKLISLAFIPFAAWYNGSTMPLNQYPAFLMTGLASFFGDGTIATRFLLNVLGIPLDMLQLYVTVDQLSASRFGTLLAGMNTVGLGLLATCAINGWVRLRRRQLLRFGSMMFLLILFTLIAVHGFFTYAVPHTYAKDKILAELKLLKIPNPTAAQVFKEPPPPLPLVSPSPSRLDQIKQRGLLRACYVPNNYPESYFNAEGDLVGANIEMTHLIANDLGVRIEFAPLPFSTESSFDLTIAERLNERYCDIYMTALAITPDRTQVITLLTPVKSTAASFIVEDKRQEEFNNWTELQRLQSLKIGYIDNIPYYLNKLKGLLPKAELVPFASIEQELKSAMPDLDAIVTIAGSAAAWTLLYPDFSVAIPKPLLTLPTSYAIPHNDRPFQDWMNAWLGLKQQDGTIESLFDYWVQGKVAAAQPPRWSVIRDVLHWVD